MAAGHLSLFSSSSAANSPGNLAKREAAKDDPPSTPAKRTQREGSPTPQRAAAVPGDCDAATTAPAASPPPASAVARFAKSEPAEDAPQVAPPPGAMPPATCGAASFGDEPQHAVEPPPRAKTEEPDCDERFFVPPPGTTST